MISKEEIKKLADLARIAISDDEAEKLGGEMDSILEYVKSIARFQSADASEELGLVNVMRGDAEPTEPGFYSQDLIAEFPEQEGDYLKVKKIL